MPNANRDKGIRAERQLADYLRNWWPTAERSVATGWKVKGRASGDCGDIKGTGTTELPIVWQLKDLTRVVAGRREDKPLVGAELARVLLETRTQRDEAGAALGLLVEKRRGHADPAEWWVWLDATELVDLSLCVPGRRFAECLVTPIRMRLGDLVPMLARAGFAKTAALVS